MGDLEPKVVKKPVVVEQDKAEPELTATTSKIDAKQRAASVTIDLLGDEVTLTVVEGEMGDNGFIPVAHPQKTVALDDFAAAIANTAKGSVANKLAQWVLDTVTAE